MQMVYGKKQTRAAADGYWIKTGSGIREILKDRQSCPFAA